MNNKSKILFLFSDQELMEEKPEQCALLDEIGLRSLYKEFFKPLCLFSLGYIRNQDVAIEMVQDTFLSLWLNRKQLTDTNHLQAFLYTSARNKCISYLRKQKHETGDLSALESELFFDHSVIRSETHKLLYEAIESLPEQTKKIIYLTLDGLKNQEIAEQLNVSINTVTTLKKSGYKKLKLLLKEHYYLVILLFP